MIDLVCTQLKVVKLTHRSCWVLPLADIHGSAHAIQQSSLKIEIRQITSIALPTLTTVLSENRKLPIINDFKSVRKRVKEVGKLVLFPKRHVFGHLETFSALHFTFVSLISPNLVGLILTWLLHLLSFMKFKNKESGTRKPESGSLAIWLFLSAYTVTFTKCYF